MTLARLWNWIARADRRSAPARRNVLRLQTLEERAVPRYSPWVLALASTPRVKVYDENGALKSTFKPYPLGGGHFSRVV